jgi:outer membrane protein, multidrug efflux system
MIGKTTIAGGGRQRNDQCADRFDSYKTSFRNFLLLGVSALLLAACAVPADPMSVAEMRSRNKADLEKLFARQEPITQPLTIHDVMARVLKYNLDNKLKIMEEALSRRQVDVADMSLLPRMATTAGYVSRSNESASSSKSITTGKQSLETSTSQDQLRRTADLTMAWNILDFGVGYVSALQQSDRALVAEERRRKVVHNILQDTRTVYWRAVAAERLQGRIGPLLQRIDRALRDSRVINEMKLTAPLEALTYQKQLLKTRQQLLDLQKELQVAKSQLATLMDLPPSTDVPLATAKRTDKDVPKLKLDPEKIEEIALLRRPELVEEAYQARIGANETRKAMLRMLPGIELSFGVNFDSNSFLLYNRWADYGARAVWNLFNVFTGPANIALAEAQESFIETRRLALGMAVLTQSRVSWLRWRQSLDAWKVAQDLEKVERGISAQMRSEVDAERRGELGALQSAFDALLAELGADLAFAETQNAAGNVLVSMGYDPLPADMKSDALPDIAAVLRQREEDWFSGRVRLEPPPEEKKPEEKKAEVVVKAQEPPAIPEPVPVAAPVADAAPAPVSAPPAPASPPVAPAVAEPVPPPVSTPVAAPTPLMFSPPPEPAAEPSASAAPTDSTVVSQTAAPSSSPSDGWQAALGTFADAALASDNWETLTKRNPKLTAGLTPVYVTASRRSDGASFVILRASGFAGPNAAARFCDAVRVGARTCLVKAPGQ